MLANICPREGIQNKENHSVEWLMNMLLSFITWLSQSKMLLLASMRLGYSKISQFLESDNLKVKLPVSLTISPLLISLT
jgi:hypothetical protein